MLVTAMLHRMSELPERSVSGLDPIVLVDGQVRSDLWVRRVTMRAPLDLRDAELVMRPDASAASTSERERAERMLGARVDVVQPVALAGADSRLLPLLAGRIESVRAESSGRIDETALRVACDWRRRLDGRIEPDEIREPEGGWTVGRMVERLNALGQLGLNVAAVPVGILNRAVATTNLGGASLRQALAAILESQRLVVQRRIVWEGHGVVERRALRRVDSGRPIRLALGDVANPTGAVQRISGVTARRRPVKLVATADGQQVESTFTLVGAWDSAMESRADGEYRRSTSVDFDAVSNVFRCWVLNEDGTYSGAPFGRGRGFSLEELFGEGGTVRAQAIPFGAALSRDEAGRSLGVVAEQSLDSGATWMRCGGVVKVLADRAGIYLDDDELPSTLISAVRAGTARVRVTATLRSPRPIEEARWRGNPFAGEVDERRFHLGGRFAYRRIDVAGKYYGQVRNGERQADVADDRAAMAAWLAEQPWSNEVRGGTAEIETVTPMPALRIGDRLEMLAGRGIGLDVRDARSNRSAAWLGEIEHRWDGSPNRLRWRIEGDGA